jgi:hypothetical protein
MALLPAESTRHSPRPFGYPLPACAYPRRLQPALLRAPRSSMRFNSIFCREMPSQLSTTLGLGRVRSPLQFRHPRIDILNLDGFGRVRIHHVSRFITISSI